jgi:hypothetical protein
LEGYVRRRDFIKVIAGSTVVWPVAARAQQGERTRRVGVLMTLSEDDPEGRERMEAFLQSLQQLGWSDGRNVKIDYRWRANDAERVRRYAAELVALAPDVILTADSQSVAALRTPTPITANQRQLWLCDATLSTTSRQTAEKNLARLPGSAWAACEHDGAFTPRIPPSSDLSGMALEFG